MILKEGFMTENCDVVLDILVYENRIFYSIIQCYFPCYQSISFKHKLIENKENEY